MSNFISVNCVEHSCEIILNLGKQFKKSIGLKIYPFLMLGAFCLVEWNLLGNFGVGPHEKMSFKEFLILAPVAIFIGGVEP